MRSPITTIRASRSPALVNRSDVALPAELCRLRRSGARFDDALRDEKPDVASINTYSDSHADYAVTALEAGCHVFVEKPLATTVADAERVVAAARANGRKLVVGYILRHHPSWMRLIAEARALGGPYVFRMNLNQQSSGPTWETHKQLMQTTSPIVDCGVHYVDVMCQITDARPVEVRGMGLRLTDEIDPDMYNYGHLQVLFDDGSVGWYEAGWGPMMSETAFFVKDVISPNGCVSIVMDESAKSDDIDTHTKTSRIRIHRAATGADGKFAEPTRCCRCRASPATRRSATASRPSAEGDPRGPRPDPPHGRRGAVARRLPRRRRERADRPGRQTVKETALGALNLENIKKSFGKVEVLKGIDLDVKDGEFVRLRRAVGLRQVHAAARHRRAGGRDLRRRPDRRQAASTLCRRPSAASPWCSRPTRSIRISPCATIWGSA